MKISKLIFLSMSFFILSHVSFALQSEHLVWEKVPLNIELPLNQERLIQFPQPIKIIDQQLSPTLDVLKIKSSLYLKAKGAFKDNRLIIQLLPEDEVIILNLKADEKIINNTPVEILIEDTKQTNPITNNPYEYNPIQLTRFAIQAFYSPERVREIPEGIYRTPMQTNKTIPLFYGANIEAHPLASWRGGDLYITAVELKNLLNKSIQLKFSDLLGHWQTASFYPKSLLASRNQHDSTIIFLVSAEPFSAALSPHARFNR